MSIPVRLNVDSDLMKHRCLSCQRWLMAAAERSTAKNRQAVVTGQSGLALPAQFFLLGSLIPLKVHFREVAALVRASSGLCFSRFQDMDDRIKKNVKEDNYGLSGS